VDDLVEGLIRLMESEEHVTGPINLGNPGEFSIEELAEKVVNMTESGSKIIYEALPQDDPTQRQPDITQAMETLGWEPKVALDQGLPRTIEYFRNSALS
jgi:UDP-glucuronate decarboxylase